MKKFLTVVLCMVMVVCVFVACGKGGDDKKPEDVVTVEVIPTDEAKIKSSDATGLFRSGVYTPKELGLDKIERSYTFMVAENGFEYDGGKYVRVVANCPAKTGETSKDGKETYTLTIVGEYLISFDGETILMKNMDTGEYKEIENRYSEYSSQSK